METSTTTSTATKTIACICGKRHRPGTVCEKAQRIERDRGAAQEVLEVVRALPAGTVTLLDTRAGRATARTLEGGAELARRYADGCLDESWGTVSDSSDGSSVRFTRDVGGYVPNSYGYAADTDELHVVAAEGRVVVLVERVRAQSRPGGRGEAVDRLPPMRLLSSAAAAGERYNSAWLQAIAGQARAEQLLERRTKHAATLTAAESVELDAAIEAGVVA